MNLSIPDVVYHGSSELFERFSDTENNARYERHKEKHKYCEGRCDASCWAVRREGHYFSSDPREAAKYVGWDRRGYLYSVHLDLKRPVCLLDNGVSDEHCAELDAIGFDTTWLKTLPYTRYAFEGAMGSAYISFLKQLDYDGAVMQLTYYPANYFVFAASQTTMLGSPEPVLLEDGEIS